MLMENRTAVPPGLLGALIGEGLGTFLLVSLGIGSVATAVLTGALQGLGEVAAVWVMGVTLAIFVTRPLSGAHLNPAVTLAFAVLRDFPLRRIAPYWLAQLAGATLAGVMNLVVFGPFLARFEQVEGLRRGAPGSERAAMIFGEYFPNPAIFGTGDQAAGLMSPLHAMGVEAIGTGILVLVIFALTDTQKTDVPPWLAPPLIGLTVGALIMMFAPLTQAGWNPARDLGPRLVAGLPASGAWRSQGLRAGSGSTSRARLQVDWWAGSFMSAGSADLGLCPTTNRRTRWRRIDRRCCSCAFTTPGGPRWRRRSRASWGETA